MPKPAESLLRYEQFVRSIPDAITRSLDQDFDEVVKELQNAQRIFLYGKGTSAPALLFLEDMMRLRSQVPVSYLSTYREVGSHLQTGDLVLLNSYSWSTYDAEFMTQVAQNQDAKIIVITANQEKISTSPVPTLSLYPENEKLFSRPASLISSYAVISEIVQKLSGATLDGELFQEHYLRGYKNSQALPIGQNDEQFSILYSGSGRSVGQATALAFSEGLGKDAHAYDIDELVHGWWVPHQLQLLNEKKHTYLFQEFNTPEAHSAVEYFLPFTEATNTPTIHWKTTEGHLYGNAEVLGQLVGAVEKTLAISGYDMNNPPGKEAIKIIYSHR